MKLDNRIKFRHLACFLEVAAQKSFVRAANELAITQPAVSKAISELEEVLGVTLLERSRGGVTLTIFGEAFRRYAGASATALTQGIASIRQARDKGAPTIAVGVLPTVAGSLVPRGIMRAKREGLDARIKIVIGPNDYLLPLLRAGHLDIVVGRLASPEEMRELRFEHLYSEHIVFVAAPNHLLFKQEHFKLSQICDYTVILPTEGSSTRPFIDRLFIANGFTAPDDVIETVSPTFSLTYTTQSDAIWIISRSVAADYIRSGTVRELPVDTGETTGPIGLTTRVDAISGIATDIVMQAIRREIGA